MGKLFDVYELKKALPQWQNRLMLDRAEIIDETHAVAVKNLTNNEEFFNGHFPNHPIMPGVLQLEAMRQLCELMGTEKLAPADNEQIYIKAVGKTRFRRPNVPGDRIKIEAELTEEGDRTLTFKTNISNAAGAACDSQITLAVRPIPGPKPLPELFNAADRAAEMKLNEEQTKALMPHRYPFLLIDYVLKEEGTTITAVKNVSANEPIFAGMTHPVMPESLLCEIGAQAGCACVLSRPENAGKLGFFMSIENADSLAPVVPGDQLVVECDLPPSKSRFGKGSCRMTVDGVEVFKSAIMFAIVDA